MSSGVDPCWKNLIIERWCAMHLPGTFTTAKTSGKISELLSETVTLYALLTFNLKTNERNHYALHSEVDIVGLKDRFTFLHDSSQVPICT